MLVHNYFWLFLLKEDKISKRHREVFIDLREGTIHSHRLINEYDKSLYSYILLDIVLHAWFFSSLKQVEQTDETILSGFRVHILSLPFSLKTSDNHMYTHLLIAFLEEWGSEAKDKPKAMIF